MSAVIFLPLPPPLNSVRGLLFILFTTLAIYTSFSIFTFISSTSRLLIPAPYNNHRFQLQTPIIRALETDHVSLTKPSKSSVLELKRVKRSPKVVEGPHEVNTSKKADGQLPNEDTINLSGNYPSDGHRVFHDEKLFLENYNEMNRTLKIYVYPHSTEDPFANVLLPVSYEPGGNYASESYFKKSLMKSHFITNQPSEADLFFLPFSIASMRNDKRIGVEGIPDFVRGYISNISNKYPYWNRTGGADHFYVACHSIGKIAMEKVIQVRVNAIQVVCTSNLLRTKMFRCHKFGLDKEIRHL